MSSNGGHEPVRLEASEHWLQTHIEVSRAGVCFNESPMTAYWFCGFVYLTAAQHHTATTTVHSLNAGRKLKGRQFFNL